MKDGASNTCTKYKIFIKTKDDSNLINSQTKHYHPCYPKETLLAQRGKVVLQGSLEISDSAELLLSNLFVWPFILFWAFLIIPWW